MLHSPQNGVCYGSCRTPLQDLCLFKYFTHSRSKCLAPTSRLFLYIGDSTQTQAYLVNIEVSPAVQLLSVTFSHCFIHSSYRSSLPFYVLLDKMVAFIPLSRTRLQCSRSRKAFSAVRSAPEKAGAVSTPAAPGPSSHMDQPRQAMLTRVLLIHLHSSHYKSLLQEAPLLTTKGPWKHNTDILQRFKLEISKKSLVL